VLQQQILDTSAAGMVAGDQRADTALLRSRIMVADAARHRQCGSAFRSAAVQPIDQ
jgi:hypothetical protein